MKKNKNLCPGCSRHCPMDAPRCKYGSKYFAKLEKRTPEAEVSGRKWEKNVQRGGLTWRLILVARGAKKALRSGRITEEALLSALDETQQAQLENALAALETCLDRHKKSKK